MENHVYENIIVIVCILSYIGSIAFCAIRPLLQERELKKSELAAELSILSEKLYKKQELRESHS